MDDDTANRPALMVDEEHVKHGDDDENKVTFFPLLHEQRQAWVLDILRRERVTSVVDIGCGEGQLMWCLCNPRGSLPDYGPISSRSETPPPSEPSHITIKNASPENVKAGPYIARLQGLDVDGSLVAIAEKLCAPRKPGPYELQRWDPLRIRFWHESLHVWNEEFVDEECIVVTEVVEHLPPDILPFFAPIILGGYRPRLLLITTPSYTYNARFSPPSTVDPVGYLDPTGRTNRVFRHHDHKFEWTVDEFREWCEDAAKKWGYEIEIGGVGVAIQKDPWGRDEELGKASQTAIFRRKDGEAPLGMNERRSLGVKADGDVCPRGTQWIEHRAHTRAHQPCTLDEIAKYVEKVTEDDYFDDGATLWNLWVTDDVASLCGGHMDVLVQALAGCPDIVLKKEDGVARTQWKLSFHDEQRKQSKQEQEKEKERERLAWESNVESFSADWRRADVKTTEEVETSPEEETVTWGTPGESAWGTSPVDETATQWADMTSQMTWAETGWR